MPTKGKQDHRSDADLVDVCNIGSGRDASRAFAELYRRHKDFVVRVSFRVCGDNEIALDALQETFSYLLKRFPPTGSGLSLSAKLTTYLYPIAKNTTISILRKNKRFAHPQNVDPDTLATEAPPESTDIGGLLTELPGERREVVIMRFVEDMSLKEISTALDIPLGTVKSRLHLAVKQLRNLPKTKTFFDS